MNSEAEAKRLADLIGPLAKKPLRIPREKEQETKFPNSNSNSEGAVVGVSFFLETRRKR
jgi:hypothetical protein